MPQVPIPKMGRSVGVPQVPGLSGIQPIDTSSGIRQIQQLGQAATSFGLNLAKIGVKMKSERDYTDAKEGHLEISDYVIQQETEYSQLTPREQLGKAKQYQSNVKAFIDEKMKGRRSDQAREMLNTPAHQSLLGFKKWSLTQEIKAQRAHEFGLVSASGANAAMQAAVALVQPPGYDEAIAASDQIPSDDPNLNTGPSIVAMEEANDQAAVAAGQDPKKRRNQFEIHRDSAFSNYEDEADLATSSPEAREAYIRNKKTGFYDGVVNTLLAQDPPLWKRAKELLAGVPAGDMNVKAKADMLSKAKRLGAVERGRAEDDKALGIAFGALDRQAIAGDLPRESSHYLESAVVARASQDLEDQVRNGTITTQVYLKALRHLDREGTERIKAQEAKASQVLGDIISSSPNAESLEELPAELAAAASENPLVMEMLNGRAGITQSRKVPGALSAAGPGYFEQVKQWRKDSGDTVHHQQLRTALQRLKRDPRYMSELNLIDREAVQEKFFALGDEAVASAFAAWDAYQGNITPKDNAAWKAGNKAAAEAMYMPSPESSLYADQVWDKDKNAWKTATQVSDRVLQLTDEFFAKYFKDHPEIESMSTDDKIRVLRTEKGASNFIFDREGTERDEPVAAYLIRAGLNKANEEGRLALDMGPDRGLVPVGRIGEGALTRVKSEYKNQIAKLIEDRGLSEDVAAYAYIQTKLDIVNNSVVDYSARDLKTKADLDTLFEDAEESKVIMQLAESFSTERWSPEVRFAFGSSMDKETGRLARPLTADDIDRAQEILKEKKQYGKFGDELLRYAGFLNYSRGGQFDSFEKVQEKSSFVAGALLDLKQEDEGSQLAAEKQITDKARRPGGISLTEANEMRAGLNQAQAVRLGHIDTLGKELKNLYGRYRSEVRRENITRKAKQLAEGFIPSGEYAALDILDYEDWVASLAGQRQRSVTGATLKLKKGEMK